MAKKNVSQAPRAMREGKSDPSNVDSSKVQVESEKEPVEESRPWEFMGESATSQKDV